MERAVALSGGRSQIEAAICRPRSNRRQRAAPLSAVPLPEDGIDFEKFIADIEREMIRRSLERTNGNKGAAARLLNLKRTTLVEKLKRLERS